MLGAIKVGRKSPMLHLFGRFSALATTNGLATSTRTRVMTRHVRGARVRSACAAEENAFCFTFVRQSLAEMWPFEVRDALPATNASATHAARPRTRTSLVSASGGGAYHRQRERRVTLSRAALTSKRFAARRFLRSEMS